MNKLFCWKNSRHFLIFFLVICFFSSLNLSIQSTSTKVASYQNDKAFLTAVSLKEDGDLNIINQLPESKNWFFSHTFNYPGIQNLNAGSAWLPLFAIAKIQTGWPNLAIHVCQLDENYFGFAIGIFLMLGLFFHLGKQTLQDLEFNSNTKLVLALVFFGTPMVWQTFFEPIGTAVVSMIVFFLGIHFLIRVNREQASRFELFLLGFIFSYLFAINPAWIVYTFAPMLIVLTTTSEKLKKIASLLLFILGWVLCAVLTLINRKLKTGQWDFHFRFWTMSLKQIHFPRQFFNFFIGPGGSFYNSPLIFVAFVVLLKVIVDVIERRQKLNQNEKIILAIAVPFVLSNFLSPYLFLDLGTFEDGSFLGEQAIMAIGIALFLETVPKKRKKWLTGLLCLCVLWNVFSLVSYFGDRASFARTYDHFSGFGNALTIFAGEMANAVLLLPQNFADMFGQWVLYLFIVFIIYQYLKKRGFEYVKIVSATLLTSYVIASALNLKFNVENVQSLREEKFFFGGVKATNLYMSLYFDFMPAYEKLKDQAANRGWESLFTDLSDKQSVWQDKTRTAIAGSKIRLKTFTLKSSKQNYPVTSVPRTLDEVTRCIPR